MLGGDLKQQFGHAVWPAVQTDSSLESIRLFTKVNLTFAAERTLHYVQH